MPADAFYIAEDGEIRPLSSVTAYVLLLPDGSLERLWHRPAPFTIGREFRKLRLSEECESGIRRLIAERDEARELVAAMRENDLGESHDYPILHGELRLKVERALRRWH